MLGFVVGLNASNDTYCLKLPQSYEAFWNKLLMPSTTTLNTRCHSKYSPIVAAIVKQLPSLNAISVALDM